MIFVFNFNSFQLPRLYNVYKEMGIVTSFQNILDNVFLPLFEVTVDPDSHPQLHVFLKQVCRLLLHQHYSALLGNKPCSLNTDNTPG